MKGSPFSVILLVSLLILLNSSNGAKILAVFPWPIQSHFILGSTLMKGLAEKGHQVTMISAYPQQKPVKNYQDIDISNFRSKMHSENKTNFFFFYRQNEDVFYTVKHLSNTGAKMTDFILGHESVQNLLKSNETFDAVIVEAFMIDATFAMGYHFGAPIIAFSSLGTSAWTNELVGNPSSDAYIPNMFLSYTDQMTLTERVVNLIANVYTEIYHEYFYLPTQDAIKTKYFPDAPPLKTLLRNTSLILMNSHVSLHYPRPLVQNIIEIGGFHVGTPKKLPEDLQKYLDEATDGVIYFSMGSVLQSKDLPIKKRAAFLEAFGKLKQKVLWKWEEDVLPNQPANVKLGKWLPQQDILAHPNVKLFITHGGLLSTTEAIARGVPLIGIPIFGDQRMNMGRAVHLGFGLVLSFDDINTGSVFSAINQVLNDPTYQENIKHRSAVLNDQQVVPLESAVYWVEYVIRHRGAKHLQSAAIDLHWTQILLLDIIAIVLVVSSVSIFSIFLVGRKIFCSKNSVMKNKQKTK